MELSTCIEDYLLYALHEQRVAQTTHKQYRAMLRHFNRWMTENGYAEPSLPDVTTTVLRRFLRHLSSKELRPRTLRSYFHALCALCAYAAAMVRQLDADAERLRFVFGSQLEAYWRRKIEENGHRRRSVVFLQATCAFRTIPAGVKVADIGAALQFAIERAPDVIRPTLDTGAYRDLAEKRLQETGEVLPGLETTPEREAFSVKFGKSEE